MSARKTVLARQGDTIDLIAARCYDGDTSMVPAILEANPGLAALGTVLPMGTVISLPDKIITPKKLLSLWD